MKNIKMTKTSSGCPDGIHPEIFQEGIVYTVGDDMRKAFVKDLKVAVDFTGETIPEPIPAKARLTGKQKADLAKQEKAKKAEAEKAAKEKRKQEEKALKEKAAEANKKAKEDEKAKKEAEKQAKKEAAKNPDNKEAPAPDNKSGNKDFGLI